MSELRQAQWRPLGAAPQPLCSPHVWPRPPSSDRDQARPRGLPIFRKKCALVPIA